METIPQPGSVIKLTVLFNLMPSITELYASAFYLIFIFWARGVFFLPVTFLMEGSKRLFVLHSACFAFPSSDI